MIYGLEVAIYRQVWIDTFLIYPRIDYRVYRFFKVNFSSQFVDDYLIT